MKNKENLINLIDYLKMVQDELQMAVDGKKMLSETARAIGINGNKMNYFKNKPSYFDTLLSKNFMSNDEFLEIIKNNQLPEERLVKTVFAIDENKIITLSNDETEEIKNTIDHELSIREKDVIHMRFYDRLTFEQAGELMDVTRERIRQLEAKAIRKLRQNLYESFKIKYAKEIYNIRDLLEFVRVDESRVERIIRLTIGTEKIISLDGFQKRKAEIYFITHKLENSTDSNIIKYFKENPIEFYNFLKMIFSEINIDEKTIMKYAKEKLTPIESDMWSIRTYNCLKKSGIDTFEDFNDFTLNDLMNIKNLGQKSLNEIIVNIECFNKAKPPEKQINIKGL